MIRMPVQDAIGLPLTHDITRIIPGKAQYPVFRRGHLIQEEDVPVLLDMGKDHVFVGEMENNMVHEDEAALRIAQKASGEGMTWSIPRQGRVNIMAEYDGLLKVNTELLYTLNEADKAVLTTLHNNRHVNSGTIIAATRIIPVSIEYDELANIEAILDTGPVLSIKKYKPLKVGLISTGNEIFQGRIEDVAFNFIRQRVAPYGADIIHHFVAPDDGDYIQAKIEELLGMGAEFIILTAGMSVDSNDFTPQAIRGTGARIVAYGVPIIPASQFMMAYMGEVPICGVPGGIFYSRHTVLDIILPRIMAGEIIEREDFIHLSHGGLCMECRECVYPNCAFGKGV